jgi:hypothetical protein
LRRKQAGDGERKGNRRSALQRWLGRWHWESKKEPAWGALGRGARGGES